MEDVCVTFNKLLGSAKLNIRSKSVQEEMFEKKKEIQLKALEVAGLEY